MSRLSKRILILGLGVIIIGAIGVGAWLLREQRTMYYTDADSIKRKIDEVTPRDILWKPAVELAGPVNSPLRETEPASAGDGLVLYFVRGEAGANADLYMTEKSVNGWTDPVAVDALNTEADELGPSVSPDGRTLYFYSNRAGGEGGYDLWLAERDADTWAEPRNLGADINTRYHEYGPAAAPDGVSLYFASNRPKTGDLSAPPDDAWQSTIEQDQQQRDYDIYVAAVGGAAQGIVRPVDALNTEYNEGSPAISPAGDFVYFSSDRLGTLGGYDLYRSRRVGATHSSPTNLGDSINTEHNELDPSVTLRGFGVHFATDRSGGDSTDYDLYYAEAREVFTETDVYRAQLDWDKLWPYLLGLLLALLALLGSLLLLHVAQRLQYRRLSLLARCLLASLIVHLLLMMIFTIWGVSSALSDMMRRGTSVRVALVSSSVGGGVAGQIRGEVTDVQVESVQMDSQQQQAEIPQTERAEVSAVMEVARTEFEIERPAPMTMQVAEASVNAEAMPQMQPEAALEQQASPVDTQLPAQAQRSQVVEPTITAASVRAQASQTQSLDAAQTSTPVDAAVAIAPQAIDTGREASGSQTLAEMPDTREAAPAAAAPSIDATIAMSPDAMSIQLSDVPQAATERVAETEHTVRAAASDVVRQNPSASMAPGDSSQPAVTLSPLAAAKDTSGGSMAALQPIEDAVDSSSATASHMSHAEPIELAAAPSVAVASPPIASMDAAAEPTLNVDAAASATTRSNDNVLPADLVAAGAPDAVQLDPNSSSIDDLPQSSLAAIDGPQAAESALSDIAPLMAVADAIDTSAIPPSALPPATDQAIYSDQESNVSSTELATLEDVADRSEQAATTTNLSTHAMTMPTFDPIDALSTIEPAILDATIPAEATTEASAPRMDVAMLPAVDSAALSLPAPIQTDLPISPDADSNSQRAEAGTEPNREIHDVHAAAIPADIPHGSSTAEIELTTTDALLPADPIAEMLVESTPDDVFVLPTVDTFDIEIPELDMLAALTESRDVNVDLPTTSAVTPRLYDQRAPERRAEILEQMGGSQATEHSVALALAWLARNQQSEGNWEHGETGVGQVDIALTGLALMAFLAADHTHMRDGPYRDVVDRGLTWLMRQQRPTGDLLGQESMYSHGIASIALAEAYGMTGDQTLVDPVEAACRFIYEARNREIGGWRYAPGQLGDTSVMGWQIMALTSAKRAGLNVPDEGFEVARRWLRLVNRGRGMGLYAYQPDSDVTAAMTAEGMFIQQLLGATRDQQFMNGSADYLLQHLPDWDEDANTYYWYYATLALFQHQGPHWDHWNTIVQQELLARQLTSGRDSGSWDPTGQWARVGGRVYQTAICALTLEVYYRYLPTFLDAYATTAAHRIHGRVTDSETGEPLVGAIVRVGRADESPLVTTTDALGQYVLITSELPEFFAASASHEGYVPKAMNVASADLEQAAVLGNFELIPLRGDIIAIEDVPHVHHLGNDRFDGRINSQFQERSEGDQYNATFELTASQLHPDVDNAEIYLLVRGAQVDNEIRINGHLLDEYLDEAPRDGSFGEFTATFAVDWLLRGENQLQITARSGSDLDDFEFVNVQIRLSDGLSRPRP